MVAIPRLDVGRGPACWGMSRLHRYGPSLHVETNLNSRTYRPRKLREGTADLGPEYKPREGGSGSRMSKLVSTPEGSGGGGTGCLKAPCLLPPTSLQGGTAVCVLEAGTHLLPLSLSQVQRPTLAARAERSSAPHVNRLPDNV